MRYHFIHLDPGKSVKLQPVPPQWHKYWIRYLFPLSRRLGGEVQNLRNSRPKQSHFNTLRLCWTYGQAFTDDKFWIIVKDYNRFMPNHPWDLRFLIWGYPGGCLPLYPPQIQLSGSGWLNEDVLRGVVCEGRAVDGLAEAVVRQLADLRLKWCYFISEDAGSLVISQLMMDSRRWKILFWKYCIAETDKEGFTCCYVRLKRSPFISGCDRWGMSVASKGWR